MNGWPWKPSLDGRFKGKPSDAVLLFCCFLFAVIFWMYVAGLEPDTESSRASTREVSVPIHMITGHIPVQDISVKAVTVTLQGPSSAMDHPAARAYVDVAGFTTPGVHSAPVRVQTADPALTVTSVMPEKAQVFLDQNQTRTLHVVWHGLNQPPAGYVSGDAIIDPDTVSVTGPSSLIGKARASVEFDLANDTESTYLQLDVHLSGVPAAYARLFTMKPPKVHVFVPIRRMMLFTTIPVEPQFVNISANFVRADVLPPVVTVSGPRDVIDNLSRAPTIEINLLGVTHSFNRRVELDLPAQVHVENDSTVLVHVEIAPPPQPAPPSVSPTSPAASAPPGTSTPTVRPPSAPPAAPSTRTPVPVPAARGAHAALPGHLVPGTGSTASASGAHAAAPGRASPVNGKSGGAVLLPTSGAPIPQRQ
ncbi:MAG TPA: CdaR family protein [Armatimonadota bacterium]|nr:CdaR family protein [Armatimonadota bacterium]